MLSAGKDLAAVLQALEISEGTYHRWRNQYGGMKAEEAVRLAKLEDENQRLKEVVADVNLSDIGAGISLRFSAIALLLTILPPTPKRARAPGALYFSG